jgi:hypothetical protein
MPEKKSIESQPNVSSDSKKSPLNTLADILDQIVTKIKNEPFLFVIGVVILLIMLVVLGKGLVSPDLHFIVVGIIVLALAVIIGYYIQLPKPPVVQEIPESLTFEQMEMEFSETLDRLEAENGKAVVSFKKGGDLSRLLDGLYSGLLYASFALIKGHVDPLFYGNLMEWDENQKLLRLRYFSGPYNEVLINKEFPVNDPKNPNSVASTALTRGENKIMYSMEIEEKMKGELLKALMSIPIEKFNEGCKHGAIVVLNIDSRVENIFPKEGTHDYDLMMGRVEKLKKLLQRVNKLRWKFLDEATQSSG